MAEKDTEVQTEIQQARDKALTPVERDYIASLEAAAKQAKQK